MSSKKAKSKPAPGATQELELRPAPSFLEQRLSLFEKLWNEQQQAAAQKPREKINITLPDGKVHVGTSWETTPLEIVRGISKSLAERTVVAKVNDELWDLSRPFEGDATLAFLDFNSEEGKKVFWHSSAHILGEAAERRFGAHLAVGPPTTNGNLTSRRCVHTATKLTNNVSIRLLLRDGAA
jgi:threonyl-tRNA synthetase